MLSTQWSIYYLYLLEWLAKHNICFHDMSKLICWYILVQNYFLKSEKIESLLCDKTVKKKQYKQDTNYLL